MRLSNLIICGFFFAAVLLALPVYAAEESSSSTTLSQAQDDAEGASKREMDRAFLRKTIAGSLTTQELSDLINEEAEDEGEEVDQEINSAMKTTWWLRRRRWR